MKTVIEMAIEAGVAFDSEEYPDIWMTYMNVGRKEIEAFAELVRADEREACAKLCDARVMGDNNREDMEAKRCAADIRSFRNRSNT